MTSPLRLLVRRVTWEAEGVLSFVLEDPDGRDLPPWAPGAHIDVLLPSGLVRQYSLCGDPAVRACYEIAVLLEKDSRGGSRELHHTQWVGKTLDVQGPRNHFELSPAKAYRLIAGGIGVTPILTMAAEIHRRGGDWKLLYGARSLRAMAFRERLSKYEDRVEVAPEDRVGRPAFDPFLAAAPEGAAIYCCGPEGMIAAVEASCAKAGRGEDLHIERFSPAAPAAAGALEEGEEAFDLVLRRSGVQIHVDANVSLLDALRRAGISVPVSCENGVCGACETDVLEGAPLHKDSILSARERAESKTMMVCVGRSLSRRLVLDL